VLRELEDVETAKRAGRTAFTEMVEFLTATKEPQPILLVADRLYRNIKDWVTIDGLGIDVHLVKEGVVLSQDSRSSEKFMHGIRVLMAKNYIDNLSEEVRKRMREKAEQGHWPPAALVGYFNNLETRRIEVDPIRGRLVAKLFEWYVQGNVSLNELRVRAFSAGLLHPRSGRRMTKSEIHRILRNPLYYGDFLWNGKLYRGVHEPIVSKQLFDAVQDVFVGANRPKYTKHRHAGAVVVDVARLLDFSGHGAAAPTARYKSSERVSWQLRQHLDSRGGALRPVRERCATCSDPGGNCGLDCRRSTRQPRRQGAIPQNRYRPTSAALPGGPKQTGSSIRRPVGRSGHGRDVVAEVGGMGDGARDNPRRDGKARTGQPRLRRHWVENSRTRKKRP
jgi:DNA invertase Pin-like site-specific DNA recombinase